MTHGELFLDTTFVMPFFGFDIDVEGFSRERFKDVVDGLDKLHVSEVSIIEAKAKCMKIVKGLPEIMERFYEGLTVLAGDEKVVIHGFRAVDDVRFNELWKRGGLGFFDTLILAQSCAVGVFLTEDSKILGLKDVGVKSVDWKMLVREFKTVFSDPSV